MSRQSQESIRSPAAPGRSGSPATPGRIRSPANPRRGGEPSGTCLTSRSVGLVVGGLDLGGNASAVAHLVPIGAGPLPDVGEVSLSGAAARSGGGSPGGSTGGAAAGGPARVTDVLRQRVP